MSYLREITMKKRLRLADERGQILIVTAVGGLALMLGISALAIDASLMYDKRNALHAAADAAAKVAAIEMRRNPGLSTPTLKTFADEQVNALGLTAAACGATSGTSVCINHPPVNGPFNCTNLPGQCNSFVEAIVSQQAGTFFARLLGRTIMTPGARAVAGVSPGPNCLVVFDHLTIKISGGSLIDMGDCSMVINGQGNPPIGGHDLDNGGGAGSIIGKTIGVYDSGSVGCTGNCGPPYTPPISYGVPRATDPLKDLPSPANPGPVSCTQKQIIGANTFSSYDVTNNVSDLQNYYCGWNFKGPGASVRLNPGIYYIDGNITAENPGTDVQITGDGVMIYLSPAARWQTISNHVILGTTAQPLTAPTSGPYTGILLYQSRDTAYYDAIFGKNLTDLAIKGAFYFPTGTIQMANENSSILANPCMVIVAWAIEVDKPNFQLRSSCSGFLGSPLMTLTVVE